MLRANLLHQPETLVAIDDGQRRVVLAGFVGIERRRQFAEFVRDELTELRQIFDLHGVVRDQLLCVLEQPGQLLKRHLVGLQIKTLPRQQITALSGFRALHETENAHQLRAYFERVLHPLVVAFVARAEPECRGHDEGRKQGGDHKTPVQQSQRFWLGFRLCQLLARVGSAFIPSMKAKWNVTPPRAPRLGAWRRSGTLS